MKSHNIAKEKADLLKKQAISLLSEDKENIQPGQRVLSVSQWFINDVEVNLLETDTVSSATLLSQKWPFSLLSSKRPIVYVFMAANDTLTKNKVLKDEKPPKIQESSGSLISMLATNSLLQSLKQKVESKEPYPKVQIRWKHDILVDYMKVGQIFFKQAKVGDKFDIQLGIEVNVKSIPKNFGAYDFQPTFLERHIKESIDLKELAQTIINNLVKDIWTEEPLQKRAKEIKEQYESELIYLKQKVTIFDRTFEHIHYSGFFSGVDCEGNALLEGYKKPFSDGVIKFDTEAKDYLSLYRGSY